MVGGNCIYLRVLLLTPMMLVGVAITVCLCSPQRVHGFETSFGSFRTGPGLVGWLLTAVWYVYVCDCDNHRVQMF